jgi:RNA polymerase sigma-70 factor (ECF subfamily)
MSGSTPFSDLMRRVRAGDSQAAEELVRTYEPAIRRAARIRMASPRMRRLLDSADVCQSVFTSFFVRAGLGQYELESPEQLVRLLAAMARNKLIDQARKENADCRDARRNEAGSVQLVQVAAEEATPSRQAAARELLEEARRRLSPEERRLAELRYSGHAWAELAEELGGTPEALRKKFARAVDRVASELNLSEIGYG